MFPIPLLGIGIIRGIITAAGSITRYEDVHIPALLLLLFAVIRKSSAIVELGEKIVRDAAQRTVGVIVVFAVGIVGVYLRGGIAVFGAGAESSPLPTAAIAFVGVFVIAFVKVGEGGMMMLEYIVMANVRGGYERSLTLHVVVRFVGAHVVIAVLASSPSTVARSAPPTVIPGGTGVVVIVVVDIVVDIVVATPCPMRGGGRTTLSNPPYELKHALGSFRLIPVFD